MLRWTEVKYKPSTGGTVWLSGDVCRCQCRRVSLFCFVLSQTCRQAIVVMEAGSSLLLISHTGTLRIRLTVTMTGSVIENAGAWLDSVRDSTRKTKKNRTVTILYLLVSLSTCKCCSYSDYYYVQPNNYIRKRKQTSTRFIPIPR